MNDTRRIQQASDQLGKWYPAGTLDDDPEWVRGMIEAMLDDPEHRCWTDPSPKCSAEAAGYDGMFGVYCDLLDGHEGPHNDGHVEWRFVNPDFEPARAADLYRQEQESKRHTR